KAKPLPGRPTARPKADGPNSAVTDQRCGHLIYAETVSDSHCVTHQNTSHTAAVANTEGISRNSRQIGFAVGFAASNTTVAFRITCGTTPAKNQAVVMRLSFDGTHGAAAAVPGACADAPADTPGTPDAPSGSHRCSPG